MTRRDWTASLSRRTAFDPTPNALTRALAAREGPVLDLTVSNPTRADLPCPDGVVEALADPAARTYAPRPFGLPSARAAVAAQYGVDPDRVVLTASTSEAYGFLFKVLCDPGDVVLAPRPSYPLFEHLARFEAVTLRPYRLDYCEWRGRSGWHVDVGSVDPRGARAILAVSPNNPTGSYLKPAERAALCATGLPLLVDEVFAAYPLEGEAASALGDDAPVVVLGGLSKQAALPQMKAGWMVVGGPDAFAEPLLERLELVADTWLSIGTPVQLALPALLERGAQTATAIRARLRRNLEALRAAVAGTAIDCLRVEGGWYAVLRLPRIRGEEAWVLDLLDAGVLVQPGWFYDFEREGFVVLSLLTPPAVFAEGVARLARRVEAAL